MPMLWLISVVIQFSIVADVNNLCSLTQLTVVSNSRQVELNAQKSPSLMNMYE